jgi:hypothetical protein
MDNGSISNSTEDHPGGSGGKQSGNPISNYDDAESRAKQFDSYEIYMYSLHFKI